MSLERKTPITKIKGIGDSLAEKFSKLNIVTVEDLLFHIPSRYQDTSSLTTITNFLEKGEGTFIAEIVDVKSIYTRFRKNITTVKVKDDTSKLSFTYFNQPYLSKTFVVGEIHLFDAKVTIKNGKRSIYNPKYEKFKSTPEEQLHLGKLIGVYPETKGLSSRILRTKIKTIKKEIPNILQDPIKDTKGLVDLPTAIDLIHFPQSQEDVIKARERLAFDEMLKIAIRLEKQISEDKGKNAKEVKVNSKLSNKFISSLPYKLTNDQLKAIDEISEDMRKKLPMNRLLNGDVGSGKTIVAAFAILNTIANGYSSILIAPTTVLAKQHYDTFRKLFNDLGINVELCISSEKTISDFDNKLIIGTHAILYQKELPKDLNLVVIDEQHRFGVEQRQHFKKLKRKQPHTLTMTATPIPRSLTEIFFGSLEVSEIREKPSNRKEIKTYYTPYLKRNDCFEWINKHILESNKTEQAFIIYPLIEETETSTVKSILNEFESLRKTFFKDLSVTYLHGRLKDKEKNQILKDYKEKKYDILLSTTVIEVGIDIPDATIMVIEDAQKFGLAQLHQLRGRIGRGDMQSYCYVIPGIDTEQDPNVVDRLKYFAKHASGFEVAEYDLEKRGPGEVYGFKQSGIPNFKVASIHDIKTLKKAREVAKEIIKDDNYTQNILENIFK